MAGADHTTTATTSRSTPYWHPKRAERVASSYQQRVLYDQQSTSQLQLRVRILDQPCDIICYNTNGTIIYSTVGFSRYRSQPTATHCADPDEGLRPRVVCCALSA
eukprot:7387051-Pyramimonas_sp.AAC.2